MTAEELAEMQQMTKKMKSGDLSQMTEALQKMLQEPASSSQADRQPSRERLSGQQEIQRTGVDESSQYELDTFFEDSDQNESADDQDSGDDDDSNDEPTAHNADTTQIRTQASQKALPQ